MKQLGVLCLVLWVLFPVPGYCADSAAPEAPADGVVTIPFDYEDNLIWVKATGGGTSLDFILDSGSGFTFLTDRTARRLHLKLGKTHSIHGVERIATATDIGDFTVSVGGIALNRKMFALDLPVRRGPEGSRRRQADGLIGQEFFRGRVVEIDYKRRIIRVLDHSEATSDCAILPIRYHGDAMCVPVSVNGLSPQWTRLDTGCVTDLEWGRAVLNVQNYPNAKTGLVFETIVKLGNQWVPNVKVDLHAQPIFPLEAGLLGNGLLSRYRVTIDGRRMVLLLGKS